MVVVTSCGDDDDEVFTPKPKAFFRIDFPEKKYVRYDSLCPFSFDYPEYALVEKDPDAMAEPCWLNISYPAFKAKIHLSYKPVQNNLSKILEQSRDLAVKHQIKASGMNEQPVLRDSAKVFGLLYDIEGNAASNVQFYLTDSTHHFIRGSLYFNVAPNIDSLKIVVDFIKKDIHQFIKGFQWKETKSQP